MSAQTEPAVFEAIIIPPRSLSPRGLRRLVLSLVLLCGLSAAIFIRLGAWPVAGFGGMELLLAAFLLYLNVRGAKASEVLLLSPSTLSVRRTDPRGRQSERRLPPHWLGVVLEERNGRVPRLLLRSRGMTEEIGRSLGDAAKRDLAAALTAALDGMRNPSFDNPQLRVRNPLGQAT